jgi:uncharacterized membrane protein YbhN (UPF0104 family)
VSAPETPAPQAAEPPESAPRRAGVASTLMRLGLGALLLALALRGVPLQALGSLLRTSLQQRTSILAAALGVQLLAATLHALKWHHLLRAAGIGATRLEVLQAYFFGYFLNNIFTGLGELERIRMLASRHQHAAAITVSVALERWTGIAAVASVSLVATSWAALALPALRPLALLQGVGCALLCGLLALALRQATPRHVQVPTPPASASPVPHPDEHHPDEPWRLLGGWRQLRQRLAQALGQFTELGPWLPRAMGLSCTSACLGIVTHGLLALALAPQLASWTFLWTAPLAAAVGQLPVSVNGIGVQETAYRSLFTLSGLTAELALAVSLLAHGLKLGVGLLGGLWSSLTHPPGPSATHLAGLS